MSPPSGSPAPALTAAAIGSAKQTFDQAAASNRIYQNNGLICQQRMCAAMTGCDSMLGCPEHPDWSKVVQFCGPVSTAGVDAYGAWWTLGPADAQQTMLTATKKQLGVQRLPTPYNVIGMY